MTMFCEKDGTFSFSRGSGFLALVALLGVFVLAAHAQHWETVRALGADIAILVGALYGVNKFATALAEGAARKKGDTDG